VLEGYAFVGCSALESVYVSANLKEMGNYVFSADPALKSFEMGDGAKVLGDYAFFTPIDENRLDKGFYYQNALKNVTIPQSVEKIGKFAFAGNTVLKVINLSGVKEISDYAFHYATALHTVTVTDAIERVGLNAFIGSSLRTMKVEFIEYIGDQAFLGTDIGSGQNFFNLTNAIEIGAGAFYNCKNISFIRMPNVEKVGDMAFYMESTQNVNYVEFGNKLVSLGGAVFVNSSLQTITLPASLKEINAPAFAACMNFNAAAITTSAPTILIKVLKRVPENAIKHIPATRQKIPVRARLLILERNDLTFFISPPLLFF